MTFYNPLVHDVTHESLQGLEHLPFKRSATSMLELRPLSEQLKKVAIDELGEVPARIPEDLRALKQWLASQPHLQARTDDQFLIQFLRGCKYSLEKAKKKLDLFFSLKSKYPEMLNVTDVDEPKFREVGRLGCCAVLPEPLNGTGPRIIVYDYNYSTSDYAVDDIFRTDSAVQEHLMVNDPYACIQGIIFIVDFSKATASHYLQMTPNFTKKLVSFLEKSVPLRIKAVYFVRTSGAAQQFFKILFPFLSEKLRQRIRVMGENLDPLIKDIPLKYLPKDYGGEKPSFAELAAAQDTIWDANREYFKENAQYGTDEELRPGEPLDLDGLFGVCGSFRKLNVD